MRRILGNDLDLGHLAGRNATLAFTRTERDKHLYVCGGTGTGKSKYLENLIRQHIRNWHRSKAAKAGWVLEKTELKRAKEQRHRTRSSFWNEPAKEVINTIELAGKLQ